MFDYLNYWLANRLYFIGYSSFVTYKLWKFFYQFLIFDSKLVEKMLLSIR